MSWVPKLVYPLYPHGICFPTDDHYCLVGEGVHGELEKPSTYESITTYLPTCLPAPASCQPPSLLNHLPRLAQKLLPDWPWAYVSLAQAGRADEPTNCWRNHE